MILQDKLKMVSSGVQTCLGAEDAAAEVTGGMSALGGLSGAGGLSAGDRLAPAAYGDAVAGPGGMHQ